jgi:hypothetical protein
MSDAPDLVVNDFNGLTDVFLYSRSTGRTELVSVNLTGSGSANAASQRPRISPDGRYVLFESSATDLVAGAPPFVSQLYARDLQTGTTILVSVNDAGVASAQRPRMARGARTATGSSFRAIGAGSWRTMSAARPTCSSAI